MNNEIIPTKNGDFDVKSLSKLSLNEIKKALYKEKPIAKLQFKTATDYHYQTVIDGDYGVVFTVPIADMGETLFQDLEPAQLLIRYINL